MTFDSWLEPATGWELPKEGACLVAPRLSGEDTAASGGSWEAPKAKGFGVLEAGVPNAGAVPKPNAAGELDPGVESCAGGGAGD